MMSRSERVYGLLLLAYLREFRTRYRDEMVQAFGDSCREAKRRGGKPGLAMVWFRVCWILPPPQSWKGGVPFGTGGCSC